jgi:hypothetical protein
VVLWDTIRLGPPVTSWRRSARKRQNATDGR